MLQSFIKLQFLNMVIVYLYGSYTPMKKLSIMSFMNLCILLCAGGVFAQEPFLELRPFLPPGFEQYPASQHVDHHHPYSNQTDNLFLRFDGVEFVDDVIYPDCLSGSSCYDGHAGIDYFMPHNTPIIAPADGYVLWASFSPPADPCPGGITPNGDQGTIILAHSNDYFTVYLHMTPPLNVSVGNNVEAGDTLGFAGNTGCAINTHLHFEVRKGNWFFDTNEPYAVDPFGWWGESIDPIEEIRQNRSHWLWVSENLVDDGDNGFQRFQGPDWTYINEGFNNDCWTSPATTEGTGGHYAIWAPHAENPGEYDIEVYIPADVGGATGAIYELYVKGENGTSVKSEIVVDQTTNTGEFKNIGSASLLSGASLGVVLRDVVTQGSSGSSVVFDAIRITPITSKTSPLFNEKKPQENVKLADVFPNPFNSNVVVTYELQKQTDVSIGIVDLSGRLVLQEQLKGKSAGTHVYRWSGKNIAGKEYPSGVYVFSITSGGVSQSKKIAYIK